MLTSLLTLDKIVLIKKGNTADVSFKFDDLTINSCFLDFTDGCEPFKVPKFEGVKIFSGKLIDKMKELVLTAWEGLDEEDGFYEIVISPEMSISKMN